MTQRGGPIDPTTLVMLVGATVWCSARVTGTCPRRDEMRWERSVRENAHGKKFPH